MITVIECRPRTLKKSTLDQQKTAGNSIHHAATSNQVKDRKKIRDRSHLQLTGRARGQTDSV